MKIKKMLCMLAVAAIAPISALAAYPGEMYKQIESTNPPRDFYINTDTLRYDAKTDTAYVDALSVPHGQKEEVFDVADPTKATYQFSYEIDYSTAKVRVPEAYVLNTKEKKYIGANLADNNMKAWHSPRLGEVGIYRTIKDMVKRDEKLATAEKEEKDEQAAKNRKDNLNKGLNVLGGILHI